MPDVKMPDGTLVRFPDAMPPEQIRSLIASKFPDAVGGGAPDMQSALGEKAAAFRQANGLVAPKGDRIAAPTAGPNYAEPAPQDPLGGVMHLLGVPAGQRAAAVVRGGADMALGGFADEGAAALAINPFAGDMGGQYDQNLTRIRGEQAASQAAYPVEFGGGQVGGALASVALPGMGGVNAFRGAGLAARAGNAALTGAAYGGVYGAGSADGGIVDRAAGAAQGAATGLVAGAAVPVGAATIGGALRGVAAPIRGLFNAEAEAGRRTGAAFARDAVDPAAASAALQAANTAGVPMVAADAGGEVVRGLARSAANTSPEARNAINAVTEGRLETQKPRFTAFIRGLVGGSANATLTREQLQDMARRANGPAYQRAYRAGDNPIMSPELERLMGSPDVVQAMKTAAQTGKSRAIADGYGAFNTSVKITDDGRVVFNSGKGGVPTYPNIQFWDYTYRSIRDAADVADRAGKSSEANYLRTLGRSMRTELDNIVPEYGQARSQAAQFFGAEDALDAGEKFVTSIRGNAEARNVVQAMNPAERTLFREGFASALIASVRESGDRANIVNSIFLRSEASRERIEIALGTREARAVEALLRTENTFEMLRRAVQGNSTTVRQLVEMGLAGGIGISLTGGNVFNPQAWMTGALLYGARRGGALIDQRVARRVGEMLASDDPRVFQNGIQIAARNPGMLRLLRLTENNIARLLGPAEGGYGAAAQENEGGAPGPGAQ